MGTQMYTATLSIIECCNCHMDFGITPEFESARRRDHAWFHCPAGHPQHYPQQSTEEKLRAEIASLEGRIVNVRNQRDRAKEERDSVERSRAAVRGHLTRMRNRIAAGVCPVPGCRRSGFAQVMAHIASVHPEWHAEHLEEIA